MNLSLSFSSLACHCIVQNSKGELWGWGNNHYGSLGTGSSSDKEDLAQVAFPLDTKNLVSFASGWNHVLALTRDGLLFSWGSSGVGQTGYGGTEDLPLPRQIFIPSECPATKIAAGADFSLAITSDGCLFAWGDNGDGQLGEQGSHSSLPKKVPLNERVVNVCSGRDHVWAQTEDGKWYSWGYNGSGQLGNGTTASSHQPQLTKFQNFTEIVCGGYHTLGITQDHTVWGIGRTCPATSKFEQISGLSEVIAVSAGLQHSLALTKSGQVFGWGSNSYGQVGAISRDLIELPINIPIQTPVACIFCGAYFSGAVDVDGSLYLWGMQVASMPQTSSSIPTMFTEFKVYIPRNVQKIWQEIFYWLFLGQISPESEISRFPVEILFSSVCLFFAR